MKRLIIFLFITLIHFGLSVLILPMTMSVAGALQAAQSMPTLGLNTLVAATRVLHFPIISLSWYSRQWFPGDWVRIPMLINSILWAGVIYTLVMVWRKIQGRTQ